MYVLTMVMMLRLRILQLFKILRQGLFTSAKECSMLNDISFNLGAPVSPPPEKVVVPAGFRWSPSFNLYNSAGYYYTDYAITSLKPTGLVAYISKTGSDTTGDGSQANPYRTLAKANAMNAVVFMVGAGIWDKADAFSAGSFNPTRSVAIVSADGPGKAIMVRSNTVASWTQQSSPNTSVYLGTAANCTAVVDLATRRAGEKLKDGVTDVPICYTKQTSIAACQANPGSYYITGTNLYVSTPTGRAPDSDILVLSTDSFVYFTTATDKVMYLDGLEIWGAGGIRTEHNVVNTSVIAANNCAVRFSDSTLALARVQGTSFAYFNRCTATDHRSSDGFSYASTNAAATVKALEVDLSLIHI